MQFTNKQVPFCVVRNSLLFVMLLSMSPEAKSSDEFSADTLGPRAIEGMRMVWSDEFNIDGKPDPRHWKYESGFVRNEELQWYQPNNAEVKNGLLVITARRDTFPNPGYDPLSSDWKKKRPYVYYTSSGIKSSGLVSYKFGTIEVRARIDTTKGSWPAIWTLGTSGEWPSGGEIDIMEFYRSAGIPSILANVAWGTATRWVAKWDSSKKPLSYFLNKDPLWPQKFHVWRMDWTQDSIRLYLDNEMLNFTLLSQTINVRTPPVNPFLQPHYFLLNLAIGSNGGDPSKSVFPVTYEVDYIRVYQKITSANITVNSDVDWVKVEKNKIVTQLSPAILPLILSIRSSSGKLHWSGTINSSHSEIPLNQLPKGIYLINAIAESHILREKIFVH